MNTPSIPFENLGAIERTPDVRDLQLGSALIPQAIPSVFKQDISWLKRNYQGSTPACGPHAASHLKAIMDHALGVDSRYTPRYPWIKLKDPASPVNDGYAVLDGTDMRSIFKAMSKVGMDVFDPLGNDVTLPIGTYSDPKAVTPEMDSAAGGALINGYGFGTTDFASVCQYIYLRKAVLILGKVDKGFWHTINPTFTTPKYGHFFTGFAYDEGGIFIIDSADPDDANAIKYIPKQYFPSAFIRETGTAVELPPSVKQALSAGQIQIALQILDDMRQVLSLQSQLLSQRSAGK